jgi:multimeric flavodoxin WrbA
MWSETTMKIAVLHGQKYKGKTYTLAHMFLDELRGADNSISISSISEFYFNDAKSCAGCFKCFYGNEGDCPHFIFNSEAIAAIKNADVIIAESPCYCMGMSGQIKTFFDHLAFMSMAHRPEAAMFGKIGLCVSTAARMGSGKTAKALKWQLSHWGVPKVFAFGLNMGALDFGSLNAGKIEKIKKRIKKIANKTTKLTGKAKPGIKTKLWFAAMRLNQKSNTWNMADREHWEDKGWLADGRPWKNSGK